VSFYEAKEIKKYIIQQKKINQQVDRNLPDQSRLLPKERNNVDAANDSTLAAPGLTTGPKREVDRPEKEREAGTGSGELPTQKPGESVESESPLGLADFSHRDGEA
jgi:hypothetical protein